MKQVIVLLTAAFLLHYSSQAQTCGSTNVALTKATDASSYSDDFSMSSMAVDNNPEIPWKSLNTATAWISIDLGQSYSICQVKLHWPAQFYFASSYTLEVSDDNQTWTTFATVNAGDGGLDIVSQSGVGRYVRLNCTQKGIGWADRYELNEFEVFVGTTPPTNDPPAVSIISPENNSSAAAGSIVINADATDSDGSIAKVEFYQGTTLLGEDNTYPYSYTWNGAVAGTYSLTAKAIDNLNATTTSAVITLTVSSSAVGWSLTGNVGTNPANHFIGTTDTARLIFKTQSLGRMVITGDGKVLVNTTKVPDAEADFAVNGNIWAKKLKITQESWADYVFDSTYKLRPLNEVEKYISQHKHLPDVPSADQVKKDGLSVGDNQATLLRKIEELTLYLIEQDKRIKQLEAELRSKK